MKKKMIALFLIVFMICSLFPLSSLSAESIHVRKVLSVVYDDSGSMATDGSMNWSYANYAMQTLCGLLNPDDELFITYMSNPGESVIPTDFSSDRQAAVDNIRTTLNSGDTPQSAITTASDKLLERYLTQRESSPDTEYWLVVISDGEFNEEGVFGKAELDSSLQSFSQTQMDNGMDLHTIYLAIGSNAIEADIDSYLNITAKKCDDGEAIVTVLSELSNSISGRYRLSNDDIKLVNDNTIEFASEISLINISILIQNSSASLDSIVKEDGTTLSVDQQVSLKYPEMSGRATDTALSGQALLIGNSGQNISSGTYTLTFSDKIDSNALDIMLEPSFELQMAVLKNGIEVTELSSLKENDVVDIQMKLLESGTITQVDPALLQGVVTYSIGYMEENTIIDSGTGMTLSGITLKALKTEIYGSLTFADFMPLTVSIKVTPTSAVTGETSLPLETSEYAEPTIPDESEAVLPEIDPSNEIIYGIIIDVQKDFEIDRDELSGKEIAMRFIITRKGIPQSKEEIEKIPFEVSINKKIPYSLLLEEDGSYSFRPLSKWPLFFYPTGILEVKATVNNSATAVGNIEIVSRHAFKDFITLFWPVLLLAYMVFYLTRRRFERSYIVRKIYFIDNGSIQEGSKGRTFVGPFTSWWKFFSHASTQEFASVVFIAGRKGEVFIKPRFRKVKDYRIGPFTNNPADIQKMFIGTDWIVPKDLNRKILIPETRVLYLRNETSIIVHYFEKWHKSSKDSKTVIPSVSSDNKETMYMYEQGDNNTSYDSIIKLVKDATYILMGTIISTETVFRQNILHTLSELRIETAYKGRFSPGEVILIGERGGQVTFEEYAKGTNLETGEFEELSKIDGDTNVVVGTDGYYSTTAGQNVLLFVQDSNWVVPGIDKTIYICVGGYEGTFYQQSDKATYVKPWPDTSGGHLPLKKLCSNGGKMSVTRHEISKLIK